MDGGVAVTPRAVGMVWSPIKESQLNGAEQHLKQNRKEH